MYKHSMLQDKEILFLDLETRSKTDLGKHGAARYVADPDFQIMKIAFSIYDTVAKTEVNQVINSYDQQLDKLHYFLDKLASPKVIKVAQNATFDYQCLKAKFDNLCLGFPVHANPITFDITQWIDNMDLCSCVLNTGSLQAAGALLGSQKLETGKALINKYCIPNKVTGNFIPLIPGSLEDEEFIKYAMQDVLGMKHLFNILINEVSEIELKSSVLNMLVNLRGVPIDLPLVERLATAHNQAKEQALQDFKGYIKYTPGLDRPSQGQKVKDEINAHLKAAGFGEKELLTSLEAKKALPNFFKSAKKNIPPHVYDMIELYQAAGGKASDKYQKAVDVQHNSRLYGELKFDGTISQRWTGRGVQLQNLSQDFPTEAEWQQPLFDLSLSALKNIRHLRKFNRAMIKPIDKNTEFYVSDLSNIQARLAFFVAGCWDVIQLYRDGGDPYILTAAKMYKIPMEQVTKAQRQHGKVAVLACQFRSGIQTVFDNYKHTGLTYSEAKMIVDSYRNTYPEIVAIWDRLTNIYKSLKLRYLQNPEPIDVFSVHPGMMTASIVTFLDQSYIKFDLSGFMALYYPCNDRFDIPGHQIFNNIIQLIEVLAMKLKLLELSKDDFNIILHVHDEIVVEEKINHNGKFADFDQIMNYNHLECLGGLWQDFPLRASSESMERYKK